MLQKRGGVPTCPGTIHTYPIVTYGWIRFAGQVDFLAQARLTDDLCGLHGQILDVAIQIGALALCQLVQYERHLHRRTGFRLVVSVCLFRSRLLAAGVDGSGAGAAVAVAAAATYLLLTRVVRRLCWFCGASALYKVDNSLLPFVVWTLVLCMLSARYVFNCVLRVFNWSGARNVRG